MMTIHVNGRKEDLIADELTVTGLLEVKEVPDPDMVSVQLNGEILERNDFATVKVANGDEVEFLYFMGGGSGA